MTNENNFEVKSNIRRPVEFIGREKEIELILHALSPKTRAWIISLTGVGGIGKTELAVQVANILKEQHTFDYIVWTTAKTSILTPEGIRSYAPEYSLTSCSDLLDTIIEVLDLDPRFYRFSDDRKKEVVKEKLRSCCTLVIVDNFETITDRSVLLFLNELPPPSKALITSWLGGFSGYGALVPQTLEGQKEIRIGPLPEKDAIDLLLRKAEDQGLNLIGTNNSKLKEVVNKSARIPLALEWVVGQLIVKGGSLDDVLFGLRDFKGDPLKYCFNSLLLAVGKKAEQILFAIPIFARSVSAEYFNHCHTNEKRK